MLGEHFITFSQEFYKLNTTGARMLDSIILHDIKFKTCIFGTKTCPDFAIFYGRHNVSQKSVIH